MTIKTKLIIGFLLPIFLLAGFFGYVFKQTREFYLDTAKNESIRHAQEVSKRIEYSLMQKLEEVRKIAETPYTIDSVSKNNALFDQMDNVYDVIEKRDRKWTMVPDSNLNDLMKNLIYQEYSRYLKKSYLDQPFQNTGYRIFGEIFITNKYGANLFQTSKTTDYMQADEYWWKAVKKDGIFIGKIEYDTSIGNYSISVAMPITDTDGQFVGVVKAVIQIIELIKQIDHFSQKMGTQKIRLITDDGRLIYSSMPYRVLEDVSQKDYYQSILQNNSYFSPNNDKLYTAAQILDELPHHGNLDWKLITEHNLNVVLKPVDDLQKSISIFSVVLIFIGVIIALVISVTISKPIKNLKETVHQFGIGQLDARVSITDFKDEMGQLAKSFNDMAESLQRAIIDLDDEINVRKKAEKAQKESEERYRVLFDKSRDGINIFTEDRRILDVNKKLVSLTGYSKEELINKSLQDIYTPAKSETKKRIAKMSQGLDTELFEVDLIKKSGDKIPVEIGATGLKNCYGHKIVFQGNIRDISKRKRMEEEKEKLELQLRQAHKLEAIGTLTGGIAHDFNNILGIIIGNIELAVDEVPEWIPGRSHLEEATLACMRAKDVVRQLLNFSRKTEQKRKPVNIQKVVAESIALLRASIPATVHIQSNIETSLGTIKADPTQIHQVLINLCTNSAHAMEETGGVLEIGLCHIEIGPESQREFSSLRPGHYIQLSVCDTGIGIEHEIQDRVFDPYFTTKEVGRGSGMGLAVVHGIVKNHDGEVFFESQAGMGTTVKVLFPMVNDCPQSDRTSNKNIIGGSERILFIDDEEGLVRIGKQMLEKIGYRVSTQTNPIKALEMIRSDKESFDLIITDMTMPQLTGYELIREVLKIYPEMPIILCTGFNHKIEGKSAAEMGVRLCIDKPLNKQTLAKAIRKALDESV